MQQFVSAIYWTCPECDETNQQIVVVPELDFSAEKSSDWTVDDSTEIMCDHCDTEFFGHVWVRPDRTDFEIEKPHKFSFTGDIPMYEEEDYEPPADPHSIAKEALGLLRTMVGASSPANDDQFTNRLVFAGAVSTMEAYLGDTLINAVIQQPNVRDTLVQNNNQLGEIKATAAELAIDPQVLKKRIVLKLRGILYHNLHKVIVLYRDAFDIELMPAKEQKDILFPAMERRHDCVHRNGRNKNGEKHTDFTNDYVLDVVSAIEQVVVHVEGQQSVAMQQSNSNDPNHSQQGVELCF